MFAYLQEIIFSDSFLNRHKTAPQHFTRHRCLPFPTLILFLINYLKRSLQSELDSFFQYVHQAATPLRLVTKGAFSQARHKLKYQAFVELNSHLLSFVEKHFSLRTWHGFRLLAIDGTVLQLPPISDQPHYFGFFPQSPVNERPLARASQLYDCLNRLTLSAVIHPYGIHERDLALFHGPQLSSNDLILLDRGYPAFWIFAWLRSESVSFCARVCQRSWSEVSQFFLSTERERVITIHPTYDSLQKCREYGLPTAPISIRLIRVPLPSGDNQVLMTSLLDSEIFPYELFLELYSFRWGIEENFKHMKCRIEMENFSGKSVEAIFQDFHAKIFAMNLAAAIILPVQNQVDRTYGKKTRRYQVNATYALSCLKNTVVFLFLKSNPSKLISDLFRLFLQTVEPVRPGRSYPRKKITRHHPTFYMGYKPVC